VPGFHSQGIAAGRYGFLLAGALAVALGATRLYSYLLFHTLVELFTVAVAWSTFFLAWNARRFFDTDYLLFVGIAGLFTGGLDALHALAYRGMGVFGGDGGADLPTRLWIAARYLQAAALLLAPLFLRRRLNPRLTLLAFVAALAGILLSIATGVFPSCYREGAGLTAFKIASEHVIVAMLAVSAILLHRAGRAAFDDFVRPQVLASIVLTMAAELAFTFYTGVYDAANMAGHLLRFVASCLMYRAIVVNGLVKPFSLLFRDLQAANAKLEGTVAELRHALAEVKTLSGLLPICARCKKIRDDRGYWTEVESYVGKRTEAQFSHGMCPACLTTSYPEYFPEDEAQSSPDAPRSQP
jgi:hypothetical protein